MTLRTVNLACPN